MIDKVVLGDIFVIGGERVMVVSIDDDGRWLSYSRPGPEAHVHVPVTDFVQRARRVEAS